VQVLLAGAGGSGDREHGRWFWDIAVQRVFYTEFKNFLPGGADQELVGERRW